MNMRKNEGAGMTATRHQAALIERLREKGISDEAVLQAILETPRHRFVSDAVARHAYRDDALPIGYNQTISQPYVVAFMTQALLESGPLRNVLEIGTGSGYQSAVLSKLVTRVCSIERIPELHRQSSRLLRELGIHNVSTRLGDGSRGWPERAPYEAIMITAASPTPPETLLDQLADGGRLLIPEGESDETQTLTLYVKAPEGIVREALMNVLFVPLVPEAG